MTATGPRLQHVTPHYQGRGRFRESGRVSSNCAHLAVDWRHGVAWFFRWLLDGDVPNNSGNWQWVAGTGNDTRPYRRFNPIRQAERFDPDGHYVRRYVPELRSVQGLAVHQPWRLDRRPDYPPPVESHRDEAVWLRR